MSFEDEKNYVHGVNQILGDDGLYLPTQMLTLVQVYLSGHSRMHPRLMQCSACDCDIIEQCEQHLVDTFNGLPLAGPQWVPQTRLNISEYKSLFGNSILSSISLYTHYSILFRIMPPVSILSNEIDNEADD